jgi:LysR family transcriptional regulator (chromosome initiation inhibitor)
MLDRDQLETFSKVVESGSFEGAATAMRVSRSAISQRVKALEESLHTILLIREKPVMPTAKGRILMRHIHALRMLERDTICAVQPQSSQRDWVPISIAVNTDSLATWFRPLVWELKNRHHIALEVVADDQNHTFERLARGEVVGCVSSTVHTMQGFDAVPLGSITYRCVATPEFERQYFKNGLSIAAVGKTPAILFDRKDVLHGRYLEKLLGTAVTDYPKHYIPLPDALLDCILAGAGYGMVTHQQSDALLERGRLVDLTPKLQINVPLYWYHWNLELPLARQITKTITAHAHKVLMG